VNDDSQKYLDELPQTLARVLGDTHAILAGQREIREQVAALGERVEALSGHVRQVRTDLSATMSKNDRHQDELSRHSQEIQSIRHHVTWVIFGLIVVSTVLGIVMFRIGMW